MTNVDKAIAVLNEVDEYQDHLPDNAAYAHALQGKGLLMPDLPEPEVEIRRYGDRLWSDIEVCEDAGGMKIRLLMRNFLMSTDKAREYAYKILAACDYAELQEASGK